MWSPKNYDRQHHGRVLLRDALVQSYNVSTARLGLAVGVDEVADSMRDLGVQRAVPSYPSLLLGAVDLSPLEVSQLYETLAAGGYHVPLNAIREVMDSKGELLQHYSLKLRQVADPSAVYLLNAAMYEVTRQGTAKRLNTLLPEHLRVAGKTGTTNGLRDSWFAGFSGEHLAVVWVGRDNNEPTGLSGASGALAIWADIMRTIPTQPLNMSLPDDVEWILIDPRSGLLADDACAGAEWIPFVKGTAPIAAAPCANRLRGAAGKTLKWFKDIFD